MFGTCRVPVLAITYKFRRLVRFYAFLAILMLYNDLRDAYLLQWLWLLLPVNCCTSFWIYDLKFISVFCVCVCLLSNIVYYIEFSNIFKTDLYLAILYFKCT